MDELLFDAPQGEDGAAGIEGLGRSMAELDESVGYEALLLEENHKAQQLGALGLRLIGMFKEQVSERAGLEERWLKDLQQYNGEYDLETLAAIRNLGGSEAFVNFTRTKCNTTEAREAEMVLPTDDRNWSIEPTPVPEMVRKARAAGPAGSLPGALGPAGQPAAMAMTAMATAGGAPPVPAGPAPTAPTAADALAALVKEARTAADAMQTEMDDQLTEAGFNAAQRQLIHHKVVMGTGILKGPVIQARVKRSYEQRAVVDALTGATVKVWSEVVAEDLAPGVQAVSPWDFFPDMRATTMNDCEFTFERHRYNRQALYELRKLPGFMGTQIDTAIEAGPAAAMSGMYDQAVSQDLRAKRNNSRFEVLEYHGPITREDLEAAGATVPGHMTGQMQGVVWLCNGLVLKACLSMLEGADSMYDVVPFERDDTCIFGFGLPFRMRHSQSAGNSSWRMILDNARLSVGPQYAYKKGKIKPENGDYRLSPMKGWEVTDASLPVHEAFAVFSVAPNFRSMFDILQMVRELSDEETGMPMIAQGSQSPSVTKTAEGMGMLMNSANVVLRRLVKEYDDWVTSRFIRRLYRWNMRYHEREDIKGDYTIKALGSAALQLMEQQTKGLMQLVQLAQGNPEFARRTKWGELYRALVKSLRINADSLILTDGEYDAQAAQAAQAAPQLPPDMQVKLAQVELGKAKLALDQQRAQADVQLKQAQLQLQAKKEETADALERGQIQAGLQEAQMRHDAAMAAANAVYARVQSEHDLAVLRLVQEEKLTVQQARTQMGLKAMDLDSRHQMFNAEIAYASSSPRHQGI